MRRRLLILGLVLALLVLAGIGVVLQTWRALRPGRSGSQLPGGNNAPSPVV